MTSRKADNLLSTRVVPWSPWVGRFRSGSKWFGTDVAFLLAKKNMLILKEKKNKTIKQDHYALWTKHHYKAPFWWVEYNESGTCSFNFPPNTQAVGLRGKCPIRHVLNCNALEDIESHWTQMDSGSTPPEWTLLPSTEVGFLHLTPFPL